MTNFGVGETIYWMRQGEELECRVLHVKSDGYRQRAQLKIEGWAGTQWEPLDAVMFSRTPFRDPDGRRRRAA